MRNSISDWAFNILVLLFLTSTIAQPFVIPTGSMESTLLVGDHVLVDKLAYSPHDSRAGRVLPYEDVKHGDIIVFRWPVHISQTYVKRVIGIPGDRIRIERKTVYRNGVALQEPYVQHIDARIIPERDDFPREGELTVPPGNYFAMGDNRDNSSDSRVWGFVPRENITGKPVLVYWSYEASTEDLTGYSVGHTVDVATHFFTKTRWDRMFKLIRPQ